jgi:hypothetical protein
VSARELTSLVAHTPDDKLLRATVGHLLAWLHEHPSFALDLAAGELHTDLHALAVQYLASQPGTAPRKASSARAAALVLAAMAGEILSAGEDGALTATVSSMTGGEES